MEYIAPSTRPKEALANAAQLMQLAVSLRSLDRPQWIVYAYDEWVKLHTYYIEGRDILAAATSDVHRDYINKLRGELLAAEHCLEQQMVAFTPRTAILPKTTHPVAALAMLPVPQTSLALQAGQVVGTTLRLVAKGLVLVISIVFICGGIAAVASFLGLNRDSTPAQVEPTRTPVYVSGRDPFGAVCTQSDLNYLNNLTPLGKILTEDIDLLGKTTNLDMSHASGQQWQDWLTNLATKVGTFKFHIVQLRSITPSPRFTTDHYQLADALSYYAPYLDNYLSTVSTGNYAYASEGEYNFVVMQDLLNRVKQSGAMCLG